MELVNGAPAGPEEKKRQRQSERRGEERRGEERVRKIRTPAQTILGVDHPKTA
jgi:hypothetical protein